MIVNESSLVAVTPKTILEALEWLTSTTALEDLPYSAFGLAWRLRSTCPDSELLTATPESIVALNTTLPIRTFLARTQVQHARIGYQFRELERISGEYLRAWPDDSVLQAGHGFALLGQDPSNRVGKAEIESSLRTGSGSLEVVLLAMLALRGDTYANAAKMIEISDQFAGDPAALCRRSPQSGTTLFYHRAQAMRAFAESASDHSEAQVYIDQAEECIRYALEFLPNRQNEVLQDYVREREFVLEARVRLRRRWTESLARQTAADVALSDAEERLHAEVQKSQDRIDGSVVRVVEVLGVFLALVAFAFGGIQIAFDADPSALSMKVVGYRAVLLLAIGLSALLFVWALRLIVRTPTPRNDDR